MTTPTSTKTKVISTTDLQQQSSSESRDVTAEELSGSPYRSKQLSINTAGGSNNRYTPIKVDSHLMNTSQLDTPIVARLPEGYFRLLKLFNTLSLILHAAVGTTVVIIGVLYSDFRVPLTIQVLEGSMITTRVLGYPKLLPVLVYTD